MFLRRLLDIHNVQKTSDIHFVFSTLSKHKMFLRRLLDIHNVQKTTITYKKLKKNKGISIRGIWKVMEMEYVENYK